MFHGKVIVILTAIFVLSECFSVEKGGIFGPRATEAFLTLKHEIVDYFSGVNISAAQNHEIIEGWDNVFQTLEGLLARNGADILRNARALRPDLDARRNATELITSKGLLAEEHHVTTADGFILFLLRIRSPNVKPRKDSLPVFLLHGLLSSCDCYINNLRNESLGFILADQGYDVWLGNIRGNRYTTKHQKLQPSDREFWHWSFDEMGQYDVPVMVDFVLSKTGFHKLNFIGHSEGTTNLITSVIRNGQPMIDRINKFVALAPAIFVANSKGLLKALARVARVVQRVWDPFGKGDIFSHKGWIADLAEKYCYDIPHLCSMVAHSMVGTGLKHYNMSRTPVYLSHSPAGTSTQNMVHWSQQCEDNGQKLMYYDYGCAWKNYEHYKQFHPPEYDLSKFIVPTYAFLGDLDWLVTPPDGEALIQALPNIQFTKIYPDFNHIDFVWGYNVVDTVFRDVMQILQD